MRVKKKRISLLTFAASSAQAIHSHASSPAANAIVLITDAQLSHADTVRDMLRRHLTNARVFVLGCGSRVRCGFPLRFVLPHSLVTSLFRLVCSKHTARSIARTSGGAAEFITPTTKTRSEGRVVRQLQRLRQPGAFESMLLSCRRRPSCLSVTCPRFIASDVSTFPIFLSAGRYTY